MAPTTDVTTTLARLRARTRSVGGRLNLARGFNDLVRLRARVAQLESDVQECRRLNKRVADLADMVAEVLLPATDRDDERLKALLDDYNRSLRP